MAQTNATNQSSLNDSFTFDNPNDGWFGVSSTELNTDTNDGITEGKQGKEAGTKTTTVKNEEVDDDFLEDDDKVFKFGGDENVEGDEEDEVEEQIKETKKEKKVAKKKEEKEETENEDEDEDETEEVTEANPNEVRKGKEDEGDDDKFFTTLAEELKEKGILQNVELKEGEPITEEQFFELHDAEIEARVEETVTAITEGLDEEDKRFFEFKRNGGKTADFFAVLQKDINLDTFDEEDQKQVDAVIQHYLVQFEELDGEELEERIEFIKSGGKGKVKAKQYFDKIKDFKEKETARLVKDAKEAKEKRDKAAKQFVQDLGTVLNKTEKVGIIPIPKGDKALHDYITKQSVKVEGKKNVYIPKFQADLAKIMRAGTDEDKQKLIALAKIINEDFELKDVAAETTTKVTKKVKSKLRDAKNSGFKGSTSGSFGGKKALTDFF